MSGSSFGKILTVTTWGESHGPAIGVVVDGVPAGIPLCSEDFDFDMSRRKPSNASTSTKRKESDSVRILSGVFEGKTLGTPISLLIENSDQHSSDYEDIKNIYRPGHADFTYDAKYGFRDYRGGGRSSGRETACRVAAGVIAKKILSAVNMTVSSTVIYPESIPAGDSAGGKVTVTIENCVKGLGEPVFDKLDALLSHAVMSVGAVKAVEIGDGVSSAESFGSEFNDEFTVKEDNIVKATNHSGGILGGMSDGSPIIVTAYIKPTPSISLEQFTVTKAKEPVSISIKGRHDSCIVPRVAPVLEAMCALVLADELLLNMSSRIDNIISFYKGETNE